MKNFNDLVQQNGFLTEEGRKLLEPVTDALQKVLYSSELRGATDEQIRLLGSIAMAQVADSVSQKVQRKVNIENSLKAMTDNEFEMYLKQKYGDKWNTTSLTPEEFERCPVPSVESIKTVLEEGRKARQDAERNTPYLNIDYNRRYK